ncbi:ATP-binding response regulator [Chitinophaga japonensis]|uniref:histidine kinase n=1 Tax=Chitinophaga japonensis TaxID=104662 RepID=A0A562SZK1_CHIJA|nr:ATP-binding protein [Chitinophaga japonensis]TWI86468.1 signal transduction histidine kinase [Chitinophaga japonensis]
MLIAGIYLNPVIFCIILLEIIIFCNQLQSFLARRHEKERLWHLILVGLLILYNLAENLVMLPDPRIPVPMTLQIIINQGFGYLVTAYMPYYTVKTTRLQGLEFHRKYGFLFLVVPFLVFYVGYFPVTRDLANTLLYTYIITASYACYALFDVARVLIKTQRRERNWPLFRERAWIYASLVFWCSSPVIGVFLGQPNWVVGVFNNVVFMLLNITLMRQTVQKSRAEYTQLQQYALNLEKEVNKQTAELKRSNEQRTNAFVNLVHETKTPITLMNNYLEEYIQQHGYNEDLLIVKRNLAKLNNDISNLFDLERYNKGLPIYNYAQVISFSQVATDNLVLFRNYCRKKKLALKETIAANVLVKADPEAVSRIVVNLVENAIKYTGEGGEISVSLGISGNQLRFTVQDNGIGIEPGLQKKIFEPYYQINIQKKSAQGMGLGLPMVKKIVDSLQGKIVIDSDPRKKKGTRVTVLLNRHVLARNEAVTEDFRISTSPGLEAPDVNISDTPYDPRKQTILLVEDNQAMISYLLKKLKEKYNVCVAFNGNEALRKVKGYPVPPDLIISDVMMDKVDGFKFARIISESPDYNHIPFIFLSAKFTSKDKLEGLKLGALDYIPKPFRMEELIQKINSVLDNALRQKKSLLNHTIRALQKVAQPELKQAAGGFELNCSQYNLTSREVDIARLICGGHSYKEIGDSLFIAERTVKKHVQNIFEKTNVSNKVQLINKLQA